MAIKDFCEQLQNEKDALETLQKEKTVNDEAVSVGKTIIPCYKEYGSPEVDRREILRYAGIPLNRLKEINGIVSKTGEIESEGSESDGSESDDIEACVSESDVSKISISQLKSLMDECISMTEGKLTYRVAYCTVPLSFDADGYPVLPFAQHSDNLKTNLSGCCGAVIFAATVGSGMDMLIRRFERTSPAKGMMLQGIGAERVESLCNLFNGEVSREAEEHGFKTKPRYSPGYGDLPITVQPEILKLTDAQRRLGITLNASYLMSPSKSVTAIIGIRK